jgi:membrane protease YdiL (CAAX protease family)
MDPSPVTLFGLAVALTGFELVDRIRGATGWTGGGAVRDHLWKWAVAGAVVLVVAVEGASPASVGWRVESWDTLTWQVATGLAVMLGTNVLLAPVWTRVGDGGQSLAEGIGSFASLSVPERLFVAVTAGTTEELAFHGYALERLAALTGSPVLAGGVSFLAFTLGHLGETWDRHAVLRIAQPALLTTLLYLWFRSLPALILVHALNDAVGLLVADRYAPVDAAATTGRPADAGQSDDRAASVEWLDE